MKKTHLPFVLSVLALGLASPMAQSAPLINGDFSSSTLTTGAGSSGPVSSNGVWPGGAALDAGWIQSSNGLWSIISGEGRRMLSTTVTNEIGLTQVNTDSKATTGSFNLSFDYNIVIGTTQSTTYSISYIVLGTDTSSTSGTAGKITTTSDLVGFNFTVLGSGELTGLAENSSDTITGAINFASGYEYIAIRLIGVAEGGSGSNDNYIAFDNVALTAVPEPGSAVLLGLGFGVLLFFRRRIS